jgi:hypothetical protein
MPYAAITYRVKPGYEDEIAEIFARFQRVSTPDFAGDDGERAGSLLGSAVFVKDDVMVRVVHYEGEFNAIAKHMAAERGVHLIEEQLAPYLAEQRDTSSPEAFGRFFRDATMRSISQLSVATHPARSRSV